MVEAGGREVRVSSADRIIFPATEVTPVVTKLDVVNYYLSVERRDHARAGAAAGDAGALAQGRPSRTRRRHAREHQGRRRVLPEAHPRGAPDYVETARIEFPSGRHADEVCPTEIAVVAWAAQMGTITFHPWPVRREDVDHPDELRLDLDPQPGTDFEDAVRVAAEARSAAGRPRLRRLPQDVWRPRHPHLRPHRAALDVHRRAPRGDRLRPRARAAPARRGDDQMVEGGARRADLRRLQPERARPHDRLGLQRAAQAGRAGLGAGDLGRAGRRHPARGLHGRDDARALRRGRRSARGDRRHRPLATAAARHVRAATRRGDMPYPPDYPKMPGEPKRVQPSRDTRPQAR